MKKCTVEGCGKEHKGLGYCPMHLRRFKLYGDHNYTKPKPVNQQNSECTVDGCGNKIHCKGLCDNHYRLNLKNGSPLIKKKKDVKRGLSLEEHFNTFVEAQEYSDCILWIGGKNEAGYGKIEHNGVRYLAHRLAYELHTGVSPGKKLVCHTCDTPSCVNPEHLFTGTHQDNMDDMVNKNRAVSGHKGNRINQEIVDEIKLMKSKGGTAKNISNHFGLKLPHVCDVLSGRLWNGGDKGFKDGKHFNSKLSVDEVKNIKKRLLKGELDKEILLDIKYQHLHITTIRAIKYGKTWKHVVI